MPKAYAVVTYRSVSDPESSPPTPSSRARRSLISALVSLLAVMRQSPVNRGLKSAPSLSNIRAWRRRRPHMTVPHTRKP